MPFTFAGHYGPFTFDNVAGSPVPSAPVSVYLVGTTTLASLYTSRSKATAAANPTATDSRGNVSFFADPGDYDVLCNGTTLTVSVPIDPSEIGTTVFIPEGMTTPAIQAAMDAAPDGSTILFASRSFTLTAQLVVNHPLNLEGSWGRRVNGALSGTVFRMTAGVQASVSSCFKVTSPHVQVRGIALDGAGAANGAAGIEVKGQVSDNATGVEIVRCFMANWQHGLLLAEYSQHVSVHRTSCNANTYGVTFGTNNMFDFGFFDCLLEGNTVSSLHLVADAGVQNVTVVRCHLGFGQYGILQDATATGNGFAGLTLIDSPIEWVSVRHADIVNGGNIRCLGGYWTWNGTPANTAFRVDAVNTGPMEFSVFLNATNANSPSVINVSGYSNFPVDIRMALNGFAAALYTYSGGTEKFSIYGVPEASASTPLDATEKALVVQGGVAKRVAASELLTASLTAAVLWSPAAVGQLYNGNGISNTRTNGSALNDLRAGIPFFAYEAMSFDLFDCNVVTAAASAVYRMGIWLVNDSLRPFKWANGAQYATLLSDLGTVDASTTGVKQIVPGSAVNVPRGRWFVVGGVPQVALAQVTIGGQSGGPGVLAANGFGGANSPGYGVGVSHGWLSQTGVTGALGNLVPNIAAPTNTGHGVGFRRSA